MDAGDLHGDFVASPLEFLDLGYDLPPGDVERQELIKRLLAMSAPPKAVLTSSGSLLTSLMSNMMPTPPVLMKP